MRLFRVKRYHSIFFATLGLLCFLIQHADAALCSQWSTPFAVGNFDASLLPEASGVVASFHIPNRLYHHNDSGDVLSFYVTDYRGAGTTKILVSGPHQAIDVEDIGRGPCGAGRSCIFLADIGDNKRVRREIAIVAIEEKESYGPVVDPLAILRLRYPDGPHNAEAMAVHPNGDFFIVTKEKKGPAQVYLLPVAELPRAGEIATLRRIGEIDLRALNTQPITSSFLVTGMDIANEGKSFVLITYESIIEFNFDLAATPLKASRLMTEGADFRMLFGSSSLPHQEAVSYLPGSRAVVYESEQVGTIMQMNCVR